MDEFFALASYAGSNRAVLVLYLLYNKGIVRKADVSVFLRTDANNVNKIIQRLTYKDYVATAVDKNGVVYCVFNEKLYDLKGCAECKFQNFVKKTVKVDGKDVEFKVCDSRCIDARYMKNRMLIRYFLKNAEVSSVAPITKNEATKEVEEWKQKDFVDYIIKTFKKKFAGVKFSTSRDKLYKVCSEMCLLIHGFIGNRKSSLYCKKHVDYIFSKMRSDNDFHINDFVKFDAITKTVNIHTKDRKKIIEGGYCDEYGIECSYFKDGGCRLKADGIECDAKIREYMKKKYVT